MKRSKKLAMRTHLAIQQREDIRRDLAFLLTFEQDKMVFTGKKIQAKFRKDGHLANV